MALCLCGATLNGQNLSLSFENELMSVQGVNAFYEADIIIEASEEMPLGNGSYYFNYNPNAFGANAVSLGNITVTVPSTSILTQMDGAIGNQPVYSSISVSDESYGRFEVNWNQLLAGSCISANVPMDPSILFRVRLDFLPGNAGLPTNFCFEAGFPYSFQTFSPCGPFDGCLQQVVDCNNFPGNVILNTNFDCSSSVVPCPGFMDVDGDGVCAGDDCDDNDSSVGAQGSSCDDGDPCTVNDYLDDECNCQGIFLDTDEDGVCDAEDQCQGFADYIDNNNNGTPDGCEGGSNPSCIAILYHPPDKTIECGQSVWFDTPWAVETCCNGYLTWTFIDDTSGDACEQTIVRTWIGTSSCGNMVTVIQKAFIIDTTPPEIYFNHPELINANSGDVIVHGCDDPFLVVPDDFYGLDICDSNPTVSMFDDIEAGFCPVDGYIELLTCYWISSDQCGNKDTFHIFVKFVDLEAPTIECPDDLILECGDDITPAQTGSPTGEDDCTDIEFTYEDEMNFDDPCEPKIIRTWTATDECLNAADCEQIITLIDNTPPDLTCPADISIDCHLANLPTNTGLATAIDACNEVEISFADDLTTISNCEWTILRTWTAADACGNSVSCEQTIHVMDMSPPEIACSPDITIQCEESADPSNTGGAIGTDLCDSGVDISYSDDSLSVDLCNFVIQRTWTATDDCGNVAQCVQSISILDSTDPIISCPADVTIQCDESTEPSYTGEPIFTDNCDANLDVSYSDVLESGNCQSSITRTWLAVDNCGNEATCVQQIVITDTTAPDLVCPDDITLECTDGTHPDLIGAASATDACNEVISIVWADDTVAVTDCNIIINRTWEAADFCGNASECVQQITLTDTTPPIISCPADLTIECDETIDSTMAGVATATDDCDNDVTISSTEEVNILDNCITEVTRTWVATNNCGLTDTCVQTLTIIDLTPPEITCPEDITIECDDSLDPSATGSPIVSDNCDFSLDIVYEDELVPGIDCDNSIQRTWFVTDNCGNVIECIQLINLIDETDPEITCPVDFTIICGDDSSPIATGEPTVSDNCAIDPAVTFEDEFIQIDSCESNIARTWSVADACGNSVNCLQTISIIDTVAATINCPQDIAVECDASTDPSVTGEPFAFDNCTPFPNIGYADVTMPLNDCEEEVIRTWTAIDNCNNSSSCTQIISITDTTAPEINCPADVTLSCDDSTDPSNTGLATGEDNCDTELLISFVNDTVSVSDCEVVINRIWTAVDNCGNEATCTQVINLTDTTAPIIDCPEDVSLSCSDSTDPDASMIIATDNCDLNLSFTFTDDTTFVDNCSVVLNRTWFVSDNCGNSAECTQTMTIEDSETPEMSCPADITIDCSADASPFTTGFAIATDDCDDEVFVFWVDEIDESNPCEKTINRNWKGIDDCGTQDSCLQIITVIDTIAPSINCPPHIVIACAGDTDPLSTGEAFGFDNCDGSIDITYVDDVIINTTCQTIIHRTFSASDDCGNASSCLQEVQVADNEPPLISCPPDLTIDCNGSSDVNETGFATVMDQCDSLVTVTYQDSVLVIDNCQTQIHRIWSSTDFCGNEGSCLQLIRIIDTIPPTIECPADLTVNCDSSLDPSTTGLASGGDDCDLELMIFFQDDFEQPNSCETIITRSWTSNDNCGNTASCDQIIHLIDTVTPGINCPPDLTVNCEDPTDSGSTGEPFAFDNCTAFPTIIVGDSISVSGNCDNKILRMWGVIDDCGNYNSCIQTINIVDGEAPEITCSADVTVECDGIDDINQTGQATATDNCDTDINLEFTDDIQQTDPCNFVVNRTWTATDDCGNMVSCAQTITAADNSPPTITPIHPMIVGTSNCDTLIVDCDNFFVIDESDAIAEDNCDAMPMIEFVEDIVQNDCTIDGVKVTMTCSWIATDDCGNSSTFKLVFKVVDQNAPNLIGVPADTVLLCAEIPTAPVVTAQDGCDGNPSITFNEFVDATNPDDCKLIREWIATDNCGNTNVATQIISVIDCIGCFGPQDVNYGGFQAFPVNVNQAELEWSFTAILHSHLFIVQRSVDKVNFEDIAVVQGQISFDEMMDHYSFLDVAPRVGNNFYRIKNLYASNEPIYSDIRLVQFLPENTQNQVLIYPNPVQDKLHIQFLSEYTGTVHVEISNELGQVQQINKLKEGSLYETLDVQHLTPGIYFVYLGIKGMKDEVFKIVVTD